MTITIEVPDDSPLVAEINSWEDGAAYTLEVTQTGTGAFTLDDAYAAEVEEAPEVEAESPVAMLMASKRAK